MGQTCARGRIWSCALFIRVVHTGAQCLSKTRCCAPSRCSFGAALGPERFYRAPSPLFSRHFRGSSRSQTPLKAGMTDLGRATLSFPFDQTVGDMPTWK
jgi:hypothetical protein